MKSDTINVPATILRELRNSLNIPENIAAKKLGITIEELLVWESEGVVLTIPKARQVARVYKYHWIVLLLDKVPDKSSLPKEYRRLTKSEAFLSTDTLLAFRNAERILYLADSIEGRKTDFEILDKFNIDVNHENTDLIINIRNWLNVSIDEQMNWESDSIALKAWIKAIENKGIYVSEYKMTSDDKVRAFVLSDKVRNVIVLNSSDSNTGKIFSLLHELVHILLKKGETFNILNMNDFDIDSDKIEVFCNKLAGKIILPNNAVLDFNRYEDDIEEFIRILGRKYKVSSQVVLRRLYDNVMISKKTYESIQQRLVEIAKKYELEKKNREFKPPKFFHQKKWIKENSTGFTSDVFDAHHSKLLSYYEVAKYLKVKVNYLPDLEFIINS